MGAIQLKRGNNINVAALTLAAGEPAFVIDTGKLYIGSGTGKVLINPDGGTADQAAKLAVPRAFSITGDVVATAVNFDGTGNVILNASLPNVVTAGTFSKVTVDAKGRVTSGSALAVGDIPNITLAKITDSGTAASKNTGVAAGNIPLLGVGGKLDTSVLPAIAISDTFVVANQTAMLAVVAETGDVAIRTDLNKSFILKAMPASTIGNWQELLTPTESVSSVNGKVGAVTLTATDLGIGNVTNESKATMFTSPALTGVPTAPTAAVATNTTQVATTAYVKSQAYATLASPVFTGAPKATTVAVSSNDTSIATTAFVKSQNYLDVSSTIDGGTF